MSLVDKENHIALFLIRKETPQIDIRVKNEFEVIEETGMLEFQLLRVVGDYELFAKEYPVLPEREKIESYS